jgi:hypothetical protein
VLSAKAAAVQFSSAVCVLRFIVINIFFSMILPVDCPWIYSTLGSFAADVSAALVFSGRSA